MKKVFYSADGSLRNGWKAFAYIAVAIVLVIGSSIASRAAPPAFRQVLPGMFPEFLCLLLEAWIFLRLEKVPLATLGLAIDSAFLRNAGLGLAAGTGLLGSVALCVWLGGGFHLQRVPGATPAMLLGSAWLFLGIALFEETLFRGYAFQRVIRSVGPLRAQLIFAFLFALVHTLNPGMSGLTMVFGLLNIFLASLMLGYCYLRSGSLALPVGVHMGWNWAQSALGFSGSGNASKGFWTPVFHGQPTWLTGGEFGLEASAAGVVVLALAVLALALWKAPLRVRVGGAPSGLGLGAG